jgi:hypothetical protein
VCCDIVSGASQILYLKKCSMMNDIYNFAFIKTKDTFNLEANIVLINRTRQHPVDYKRIIYTAPRRNWTALIVDSAEPDHYLLRNLSGRLGTQAFEFGINAGRLYFRLHKSGRTECAFESDIVHLVNQKLQMLFNTGDVKRLDLAEPAGRFVLRRYHEHQRTRSWTHPISIMAIPPSVESYYDTNIEQIKPLLMPNTDLEALQGILQPGTAPDIALEKLSRAAAMPYITADEVETAGLKPDDPPRIVKGYDILKPSTWPEGSHLPTGWDIIPAESWEKETT